MLAGVLEDIEPQARDHKLRLLHVNTKPFALHASLPDLEFGYAFLKGVRDDHKIIGVQQLPREGRPCGTRVKALPALE